MSSRDRWLQELIEFVQAELALQADPEKARGMQAYMKTDMPFYGVQKPARVRILRDLRNRYPPEDRAGYEEMVAALWQLPHREEKYLAQAVATAFPDFLTPTSVGLYRRFIVEGAWWDFVDETATHMIRPLLVDHPAEMWPIVDKWVDEEDLWLRRAALICQIGAKEHTDAIRLFGFCEKLAPEPEFFIRKAIGWALREYAKTDPDAVRQFVLEHRDELSPLSLREATKHIGLDTGG